MTIAFVYEESIRWSDVDLMGVLNNALHFTFFEQARLGYFRSLGLMQADRFPFVLGSTAARFTKPGRVGMRLQVAARVVRLGRKSLDMEFSVACGGETLSTGAATLVWVDTALHSVPIPDSVRAAIAAREAIAPGP
jgi:acyl-CoA thioester hydrolase